MASGPPKAADPPFPPTVMGYPPPPPQGVDPYLPFSAAQEASDGAGTGQAGFMTVFPVCYDGVPAPQPKRKAVKIACTNCANACRRCDEGRPCQRCVKFQMEETCVDTERKERKKGIKHRPIKRREKLPATKNTPATEHREKLPATKNTPATEHIPDPAAPDPAWVPCTPLGFMCCPPPGFIPNAPPLPHGLQYFLPPYAHPFPYPGFFYPPFPAPFPIEQPMMTEGDHTE